MTDPINHRPSAARRGVHPAQFDPGCSDCPRQGAVAGAQRLDRGGVDRDGLITGLECFALRVSRLTDGADARQCLGCSNVGPSGIVEVKLVGIVPNVAFGGLFDLTLGKVLPGAS